ncbi:MAG: imidazole glycerol phosphate synthase subunit HisH [Deltaproteobacteria bacterium]|jgi:glutamine amidotransferase|nr:imidazole glycerol phosphate synthase subunit HisH [Deltaproteobacteria bacterium]
MIAILDYGAGNQTSVRRALSFIGIEAVVTDDRALIAKASGLIFPGVGAAGQAMRRLNEAGLDVLLREWAADKRPLLGVCLGSQILLEYSEENDTPTLGIFPGKTRLFAEGLKEEDGRPISVPHMGWNSVTLKQPCVLFEGVAGNAEFYFVHSYYTSPAPEYVIATTHYGQDFCSVLGRDGFWATQFHVEKSGKAGLKVLENFCRYCGQI